MTFLEKLKQSTVWDGRYNLPLVPRHSNPWIYMAYSDLVCRVVDGSEVDRSDIRSHFIKCDPEKDGLFYRWPDRRGGHVSHDEILGAAALHPTIASWILRYLEEHDGEFNVWNENDPNPERFNVFRIPWLKPYLQAATHQRRVGLMSQAIWAICLLVSIPKHLKKVPHPVIAGARLRYWLMSDRMRDFPLCLFAIEIWKYYLKRRGITLRDSLLVEPGDEVFRDAPEEWIWPEKKETPNHT